MICAYLHAQENHNGSADSINCTEADAWEAILQHERFTRILDRGTHLVFDNAYYMDSIGLSSNAFKGSVNCMFQSLFDPRSFEYICKVERKQMESHYNATRRLQKSDIIGKRIPLPQDVTNKTRNKIHFINTEKTKLDIPYEKDFYYPYRKYESDSHWEISIIPNWDFNIYFGVDKNSCEVVSFTEIFFDNSFCHSDYNLLKSTNLQMSLDSFLLYEYPSYLQAISDYHIKNFRR